MSSDCPCPLERKVLIQALQSIVQVLGQEAKAKVACCPDSCTPAKRVPGDTELQSCSSAECTETAVVPYSGPVKACKSSELRAGVFYSECRCLKRDGLQRACRRVGCSDRCGFVRPAIRQPVPLGTSVPGVQLQPTCCPGRKEADRLKFLHEKADLLKRKPPLPPLDPLPLPPAPPYNWTGTFSHVCQPDKRCPRKKPPIKYPCGGPNCKHWQVPNPCTLPVCRADCFEQPPGWPTCMRS